jgi:hypothetical protein
MHILLLNLKKGTMVGFCQRRKRTLSGVPNAGCLAHQALCSIKNKFQGG